MTDRYWLCRRPHGIVAGIALFIVIIVASGACGTKSPTGPGNGQPAITDVLPATLVADSAPQPLVIRGTDFSAGLILVVRAPDARVQSYEREQLQDVLNVSFHTNLMLPIGGDYFLSVRNPGGLASTEFRLRVEANVGSTTPSLNGVTPQNVIQSAFPQSVTVDGTNLSNLVSVTVIDPALTSTTYGTEVLSPLSATSFQLTLTLSRRGTYLIRVQSASGETSNTVSFIVS